MENGNTRLLLIPGTEGLHLFVLLLCQPETVHTVLLLNVGSWELEQAERSYLAAVHHSQRI